MADTTIITKAIHLKALLDELSLRLDPYDIEANLSCARASEKASELISLLTHTETPDDQ